MWVGGWGLGSAARSSPFLTTQSKTSSPRRRYSISLLSQNWCSQSLFWFPACLPPPPLPPAVTASFLSASNSLQFLKRTSLPYQHQSFIYNTHEWLRFKMRQENDTHHFGCCHDSWAHLKMSSQIGNLESALCFEQNYCILWMFYCISRFNLSD